MVILLKLLAVYIFLTFLILGLYFSKVKINIKHLEFENIQKKVKSKYDVNLGIYLYGKIKIFGITFEEKGIKFLWKKISYEKIKNSSLFSKMSKMDMKEVEKGIKISELKELKPQLEKLDLSLDLGFENVLLTSFMIFAISTILSITVRETVKKYNPTKYKYVIMPHYRTMNMVYLKVNSIIAVKTVHIISILLKYKKRRVKNYERTSYRRSYENSYE